MFDNWNDPVFKERIDIVFSQRDKNYGAYAIRIHYRKRLLFSFIFTVIFILIICLSYFITELYTKKEILSKLKLSEIIILSTPPPIDKTDPPPLPLVPPRLVIEQAIKFVPPVVIDNPIKEEQPPVQENIMETQTGVLLEENTKENTPPPENPVMPEGDADKVFTFVEEMPSFPGGDQKMTEFIKKNINYPAVALNIEIEGKVYMKFMVDKDGKVRNPELVKGIGYGCDEEAMRVINEMPNWIPGKQNGVNVKVGGMTIFITFKLK
ncbi:MAG: energy transducer TonB [Bacteroidia bacterium]